MIPSTSVFWVNKIKPHRPLAKTRRQMSSRAGAEPRPGPRPPCRNRPGSRPWLCSWKHCFLHQNSSLSRQLLLRKELVCITHHWKEVWNRYNFIFQCQEAPFSWVPAMAGMVLGIFMHLLFKKLARQLELLFPFYRWGSRGSKKGNTAGALCSTFSPPQAMASAGARCKLVPSLPLRAPHITLSWQMPLTCVSPIQGAPSSGSCLLRCVFLWMPCARRACIPRLHSFSCTVWLHVPRRWGL